MTKLILINLIILDVFENIQKHTPTRRGGESSRNILKLFLNFQFLLYFATEGSVFLCISIFIVFWLFDY